MKTIAEPESSQSHECWVRIALLPMVNKGYRMLRFQPFDMFPQTEQVENVVLLEKN
jgi:hypothetical protein